MNTILPAISQTTKPIISLAALVLLLFTFLAPSLSAQETASGYGFNYFNRQWITDDSYGAGFSFYAGVWPIMQEYPGPQDFQLGLPSTWMAPQNFGNVPAGFYNTIEGGLGWWHDTRFGTETPKFIMGGVSNGFSQWANGVGAGKSFNLPNGQRNWSTPGGKYGVAQLSNNLLWAPDGLNMEQGANGDFLGYGYHPLPITDVMEETYGVDFTTGNQCWSLFLNTTNFKGPTTFFLPTFWTEPVLNDPSLEGLFLDTRPTDKNLAFAIEYADSPALTGEDANGNLFARILPLAYPATTASTSETIREVQVYRTSAKWDAVATWFDGGAVPTTVFEEAGTQAIVFSVNGDQVDGNIKGPNGSGINSEIDQPYAERTYFGDQTIAGFEWDTDVVTLEDGNFVMPSFYKLNANNKWEAVNEMDVPAETGLLDNEPAITPRPEDIPYVTPMEPDCHLQDPQSAWNSPGPSAGPFYASLGDGSRLKYYWYRFDEQPAIVHANLPAAMVADMQTRIELIHSNWDHTQNYLPDLTAGELVGLDAGLLVTPPEGMEIGYVPIVTRQELDPNPISICPKDLNSDGLINVTDVVILVSNQGCVTDCIGDMNVDGSVNTTDLLQLIAALGTVCD